MLQSLFFYAVVHRRADAYAVCVLFALTVASMWGFLGDEPIVGPDPATQYYPWYAFLGESLRAGDIPAWNPHQFSGAPFAADPLSGWTYLPAMLLFAFLPLAAAAKAYAFLTLFLAGLFAYALARALGMGTAGASLAAVAYEYNGFLYLQNICCLPYAAVLAWLPLAILGVETAIRSRDRMERILWWGISGLGLSQILAAWLGQGSYYALLALGSYVVYRTVLSPPDNIRGLRDRLSGCVLHGGAVLVFGFGLAAAGVLPRLEYNALSNLAGGYSEADVTAGEAGGWAARDWGLLLEPGFWYAGFTVLALALVAPVVSGRRYSVPFFAGLCLCALILSGPGPTPLHSALYLLPYIERLHPHDPDRIMLIFYLGSSLLAGAALTVLGEKAGRKPLLLLLPVLAALLLAAAKILPPPIEAAPDGTALARGWGALSSVLYEGGVPVPAGLLLALVLAVFLVPAYALLPDRRAVLRGLVLTLLVLVVFADLLAASRAMIVEHPYAVGVKMDLDEYYRPSGAARFLQARGEEEEFRYFGFGPKYVEWGTISTPVLFRDPATLALEPNNRAMPLGLQNVQGYNAVSVAGYGEYMRALNGVEQNYHHADVLDRELDSPLLDLLGARYAIVPADAPPENQAGLRLVLQSEHPVVYEDGQSKVLENEDALPRAWIVHSARQVSTRQEALDLLSAEQVDPRETALLEDIPPEMSEPEDPSGDRVSITEYGADSMQLESATGAPGLLVLGEVYYPAWKAYVDGEPAPVYLTDHLLRSVPIPAGEHIVELRYESWTLWAGMAISLFTLTALIVLAVATGAQRWRKSTGDKEPTTTT